MVLGQLVELVVGLAPALPEVVVRAPERAVPTRVEQVGHRLPVVGDPSGALDGRPDGPLVAGRSRHVGTHVCGPDYDDSGVGCVRSDVSDDSPRVGYGVPVDDDHVGVVAGEGGSDRVRLDRDHVGGEQCRQGRSVVVSDQECHGVR